jgi:WD40 repeat protein
MAHGGVDRLGVGGSFSLTRRTLIVATTTTPTPKIPAPSTGATSYDAFVSYSHAADGRLAPALQAGLQSLAKPWYRRRALRVFRDETSLSASPELWPAIEGALSRARYFVLLASPEAAASHWVDQEVRWWRAHRSHDTVMIALTGGELRWDDARRDFDVAAAVPPGLRGWFPLEPLWVDLRWARDERDVSMRNPRFRDSVGEVAAPLHGLAKDELIGEDISQHRRTLRLARGAVALLVLLLAVAVVGGIVALVQRNNARNQSEISGSRELAAQSLLQLSNDPELSLLLAMESANVRHTAETLAALRRSLAANHLRRSLPSSGVPLRAAAWSPDGRLGAAGDQDGQVRVWDTTSGRVVQRLRARAFDIRGVAFDGSGTRLLVNPREGNALIWTFASGKRPVVLREPVDFRVLHAGWSPNGELVVTAGTVTAPARLWDAASGRLRRSLGPPGCADADFSPDGRLVATVGPGGFVHIWKVASGRFLLSMRASGPSVGSFAGDRSVSSVRFSPDGRRLLTAAGDGTARIFEVRSGRQLAAMAPHDDVVSRAVWSPDGREVVTASDDHTSRLWDPGGGGQFQTLRGQTAAVEAAQFSPDGDYVLTAGADGLAEVFDTRSAAPLTELRGHRNGAVAAAFSPDGRAVLTAGEDGTARVWDLGIASPHASPKILLGNGGMPTTFWGRPDPTARLMLTRRTQIRDSRSGRRVAQLAGDPEVVAASFDRSGQLLFTAIQRDISAVAGRLWDARSGRLTRVLAGPGSAAEHGVLSEDGALLATADDSGSVTIWQTATGKRLQVFKRHTRSRPPYSLLVSIVFSHDGTLALTGDTAGKAYLWRTSDGRVLNSSRGPPQPPRSDNGAASGAISRDNQTVLFTDPWDPVGKLYRVGQPAQIGMLRGTRGGIRSARFNADATLVVTNGGDGNRVWDVASRETLLVVPDEPATVAFANDGRSIVSNGSTTSTGKVSYRQTFSCEVCGGIDSILALAHPRVSRSLTTAERSLYLHR